MKKQTKPSSGAELHMYTDKGKTNRRGICILLLFIILSLILIGLFARPVVIKGESMSPALSDGDIVLLNISAYISEPPDHGDIVCINGNAYGEEIFHPNAIKRVYALPYETIADKGEKYAGKEVPSRHIFVLGDNERDSIDSRQIGPIGANDLMGKAWVKLWPNPELL